MISGADRVLAVALLLLGHAAYGAGDPQLAGFLATLSPAPQGPMPYVEQRMSALLAAPLEVRGDLTLGADGSIDKRVTAPAPESLRITATSLTLEKGGKRRVIKLSGDPRWRAFHAGVVGLLNRDAAALERVFAATLVESPAGWTLDLRPLKSAGRNGITLVRATGTGTRLVRLRLEQGSAEWQELDFAVAGER